MNSREGAERGYLCVDDFLGDVVGARALASALELGIVDTLIHPLPRTVRDLAVHARLDDRGMRLLASMLSANGVVEVEGESVRLSAPFRDALRYRDLMEAKLDFAALVAPDFINLFTTLLADPGRFFGQAKLFELFSYDRCFDATPENYAHTSRWMRFTTALTKYEADACFDVHDFSSYKRMLDVGGNSGEFALRACRRYSGLWATVHDLPLVCDIGAKHVDKEPEAGRIAYSKVVATDGAFPDGHDLIAFKSMLHDWPDDAMQGFLERAGDALAPGGTVLIFERAPVQFGDARLAYAQIPLMLFFRSYRAGADYAAPLRKAGFRDIAMQTIALDMPFILVTARK